jgi:two-component system NarL family response regulator
MSEKELITVAIVDHDKDFFENSLALLRKEKDIEVRASYLRLDFHEVAVSEAAANDVCESQPDVLIHSQMIIREAVAKNWKSVLTIRHHLPHTKIVLIYDHYNEDSALVAIREGVRGLYLRSLGPSQILSCVRTIARGEVWMDASLISRVIDKFSKLYKHIDSLKPPTKNNEAKLSLLSQREMEILELVSKSYTNVDIGHKLFISEKTVKTHIKNIFEKLEVRNRVEATLVLIRRGLSR